MSENIGEEIVTTYLRHCVGCNFVETNVRTPDLGGEIDVVGIHWNTQTVYIAEVAMHISTGLQYTRRGQIANVEKIVDKFGRAVDYADLNFPHFKQQYQFWSPVVKTGSQLNDILRIDSILQKEYHIRVEFVINKHFADKLFAVRDYAATQTGYCSSPVVRMFQILSVLS